MTVLLKRKVKVLCWVMTCPKTIQTKAKVISETWGPHCDVTLYISSAPNRYPLATVVNVSEGRQYLTMKSKEAFLHVYEHYFNTADWFVKADDDTFLIVENLRYLLAHYDPRLPLHFGHQFYSSKRAKFKGGESWHSGGSGYVLSREALRRLATRGIKNETLCPWYVAEDFYIGRCLERLNVVQGLSADRNGKPTFMTMPPSVFYSDGREIPDWYKKYSLHHISKVRHIRSVPSSL